MNDNFGSILTFCKVYTLVLIGFIFNKTQNMMSLCQGRISNLSYLILLYVRNWHPISKTEQHTWVNVVCFLKWLNKMTLTKRKLPLPYQFRKEMSESNNRVILYLIKHVQGTRWKRELTTNSYRKGRQNTWIMKNLRPQCL